MRKRKIAIVILAAAVAAVGLAAFLGRQKSKSTDELLADLNSKQERDRIVAVRNLPVRTEEAARIVPALVAALKDKQPDIRLSAAIKLGSFGEAAREAIPALQAAQQDRDARVREAAGNALSRIDATTFPKLSPEKSGG